jgi:hypothetical protein
LIAEIVLVDPAEGVDIPLSYVLRVFRGLCNRLITHSEESYQLWVFLIVCVPETSKKSSLGPILVVAPQKRNLAVKT